MNRTPTDQTDEADFTTWDLKKIFGAIDALYQDLLKDREKLQKIPASRFTDFLQSGTMPDRLRPTLYDFVAWEALDFYTSAEQAGAQPEDAFEIDAGQRRAGAAIRVPRLCAAARRTRTRRSSRRCGSTRDLYPSTSPTATVKRCWTPTSTGSSM